MSYRKGTPEYEAWKNSPEYEAWKNKISAAKTGKKVKYAPRPNLSVNRKGKKHTSEARAKMSTSRRGVKFSEERKQSLREACSKRIITPELREIYSAAARGRKHTAEERLKISQSLTGRPMSEEAKANLRKPRPKEGVRYSEGQKARYARMTDEERGIENARRLKAIRNKDTDLEQYITCFLDRNDIAHEKQKRIGRYVVDFLLTDQDVVLEANGCFWHGCPTCGFDTPKHTERRAHDERRSAYLVSKGYIVITLWYHELLPLMKEARGEMNEQT